MQGQFLELDNRRSHAGPAVSVQDFYTTLEAEIINPPVHTSEKLDAFEGLDGRAPGCSRVIALINSA
jgi:hypothetical protein